MAAGCNCKAAIGCVDARAPVRASYVSLYKWPESDAEFVKSVAMARRHGGGGGGQESPAASASYHYYYNGSGSMRNSGELLTPAAGYCSPRVVDSYSCRQMYLRSYTFSKKKETVPERTMACLGRVRERGAAVFPLFLPQRQGGGGGSSSSTAAAGSDAGSVGGSASNRIIPAVARSESRRDDDVLGLRGGSKQQARRRRRRKKKKGCAVVRRLHEASCVAVRAIFRRLLACTTSVDVADGASAPPQP
ncbi:hypothetical protein BDA96_09G022500 [Sorghum bicolor]|jgi:hypothetical protein|uniref:Uncharacterized protein n=2 Tax=Sorghum bicolor TaxID=4558 RepID=A0A921U3A4_SORBI|nr:uncharacterized protein LOC8071232 [Sorghum bicolor]EES18921.1 hypothetical protein SORBI_3009G021700 [Sorghum bicolor]KAG0516658.1 hypothetical protein BDA96_09G022500 [Sorghum bicolor]|eukprot:XP_002440491.1 uncharacterized protein LOC8071232 [Sorghum bicolor]